MTRLIVGIPIYLWILMGAYIAFLILDELLGDDL